MKNKIIPRKTQELVENVDFYMENGLFVLTEKYHKDRGYCCKSGCRHCPYNFKKQQNK
jgi:hypothetical protein